MPDYDEKRKQVIEQMIQDAKESPAFPTLQQVHPFQDPHPGMTLRQWMAGMIGAGIATKFIEFDVNGCPKYWNPVDFATVAGSMADAIIREDVVRTLEAK